MDLGTRSSCEYCGAQVVGVTALHQHLATHDECKHPRDEAVAEVRSQEYEDYIQQDRQSEKRGTSADARTDANIMKCMVSGENVAKDKYGNTIFKCKIGWSKIADRLCRIDATYSTLAANLSTLKVYGNVAVGDEHEITVSLGEKARQRSLARKSEIRKKAIEVMTELGYL